MSRFLTKVQAAGEMSQKDIEPGGEYHDARLQLEAIMDEAGVEGKVKPFDTYSGPLATVDGGIELGFGEDDQFYLKKGAVMYFEGDQEAVVKRLRSFTGKHLKLVKSFTTRIVAKYIRTKI